ncbi:hypothetical protein MPER_06267 [Moniliophthora perniciosa FA553]|nr:hypothetical protein MPER_06267 [Moniliophthora perniciosa FA553]
MAGRRKREDTFASFLGTVYNTNIPPETSASSGRPLQSSTNTQITNENGEVEDLGLRVMAATLLDREDISGRAAILTPSDADEFYSRIGEHVVGQFLLSKRVVLTNHQIDSRSRISKDKEAFRPTNKSKLYAVKEASSIKAQLESFLKSFDALSDAMPAKLVDERLCQAEGMASDAREPISAIRREMRHITSKRSTSPFFDEKNVPLCLRYLIFSL